MKIEIYGLNVIIAYLSQTYLTGDRESESYSRREIPPSVRHY